MEMDSVIKYIKSFFDLLQDWKKIYTQNKLWMTISYGLGASEPILTKDFLFGHLSKNQQLGSINISSCCIIIDNNFIAIWLEPQWSSSTKISASIQLMDGRRLLLDLYTESFRDLYEDRYGLNMPQKREELHPIGIPDLFIALKSIISIKKEISTY